MVQQVQGKKAHNKIITFLAYSTSSAFSQWHEFVPALINEDKYKNIKIEITFQMDNFPRRYHHLV